MLRQLGNLSGDTTRALKSSSKLHHMLPLWRSNQGQQNRQEHQRMTGSKQDKTEVCSEEVHLEDLSPCKSQDQDTCRSISTEEFMSQLAKR